MQISANAVISSKITVSGSIQIPDLRTILLRFPTRSSHWRLAVWSTIARRTMNRSFGDLNNLPIYQKLALLHQKMITTH